MELSGDQENYELAHQENKKGGVEWNKGMNGGDS
jgi:hypothetical protein